jgi:hypothetical protein
MGERMKLTYYVPIYEWGDSPDTVHGGSHGLNIYPQLDDLYCFEPDAIGHWELAGILPTENEFKEKYKLKSDAV